MGIYKIIGLFLKLVGLALLCIGCFGYNGDYKKKYLFLIGSVGATSFGDLIFDLD